MPCDQVDMEDDKIPSLQSLDVASVILILVATALIRVASRSIVGAFLGESVLDGACFVYKGMLV